MTRYGIAIVGIAVICCTIVFIEGRWIYAMAIAVEVVAIVFSDIMSPHVDAKKDLREAYPPKRDRFHRDLERLNKLRDTPPMVLPRRPAKKSHSLIDPYEQEALTKMVERSVQSGYEYTVYWTGEKHVLRKRPRY